MGSLAGAGTVTNTNVGTLGILTVGGIGATSSFSGELMDGGGSLGLVVQGPGTLILSGSDEYSGGTTVESGSLLITTAAALPSGSSLAVGAGGTFIFDPTATAAPVSAAPASAGAVEAVPEPGSLAMIVVALLGVAAGGLCRARRQNAG